MGLEARILASKLRFGPRDSENQIRLDALVLDSLGVLTKHWRTAERSMRQPCQLGVRRIKIGLQENQQGAKILVTTVRGKQVKAKATKISDMTQMTNHKKRVGRGSGSREAKGSN